LVRYEEKVSYNTGTRPVWQPKQFLLIGTNLGAGHSDFVEITNTIDWIPVPLVKLDPQHRDLSNGLFCAKDAKTQIRNSVTNRADRAWLKREPPPRNNSPKSQHPGYITAGRTCFGHQLYVTNAQPEYGYYWKLSSSPPRYAAIDISPPENGFYAASFGNELMLWRNGKEMGTICLPEYNTYGRATFGRVALTPFAVAADTAIAGGLAAVGTVTCGYLLIYVGVAYAVER
jgi:hypothetical protein